MFKCSVKPSKHLLLSTNNEIYSKRTHGHHAGILVRGHIMATLHAEVPQQLWQQAQNMVDRGWVSNLDALVSESLQRYLESHQETMTEQFIREDVEWGLRGHD